MLSRARGISMIGLSGLLRFRLQMLLLKVLAAFALNK